MARDSSIYVRRAVIARLKEIGTLTQGIVGDRSYGPNPPADPTFPFNRYGLPTTLPMRATGLDGNRIALTLHAFAKGTDDGAVSVQAAAIVSDLEGLTFDISSSGPLGIKGAPYPAKLADVSWTGTTTLQDGTEPNAWHAVIRMDAAVVS